MSFATDAVSSRQGQEDSTEPPRVILQISTMYCRYLSSFLSPPGGVLSGGFYGAVARGTHLKEGQCQRSCDAILTNKDSVKMYLSCLDGFFTSFYSSDRNALADTKNRHLHSSNGFHGTVLYCTFENWPSPPADQAGRLCGPPQKAQNEQ